MPLALYPQNSITKDIETLKATPSSRQIRKNSLQAYWDRYWRIGEPFCALKQNRQNWLFSFLNPFLPQGRGLILGCEEGSWLHHDCFKNLALDACDVSKLAIERAKREIHDEKIRFLHECFPFTRLASQTYDWVYLLDLIAEIEPALRRIGINELARVCRKEGFIVISTALERRSPDALEHLLALLQTELEIIEIAIRYDHFDVFLEKARKHLPFLEKLMNRFFFKGMGPAYTVIICRPKKLR